MFALPLAFNLSCRMERLFNSSITRKCPPEQRRSRVQAGMHAEEAGYLDYPHLSACNICCRTEEGRITRTPPWKISICCKALNIPVGISRVSGLRVIFFIYCVTPAAVI